MLGFVLFTLAIAILGVMYRGRSYVRPRLRHSDPMLMVPGWMVTLGLSSAGPFCLGRQLYDLISPPNLRLLEIATSFTGSQVVMLLAHYGIPDLLQGGPLSPDEIVSHIPDVKHVEYFTRFLNLAAALGLLSRKDHLKSGVRISRFGLTRLSLMLCSHHPMCVTVLVKDFEDTMALWGKFKEALKTGQSPYQLHRGKDLWEDLGADPDRSAHFAALMTAQRHVAGGLAVDYPWGKYPYIVDVGGNTGGFLAELLEQYPGVCGCLFDMPQVVEQAKKVWGNDHKVELLSRVQFHGGDFFDPVSFPVVSQSSGHTLFLMRQILHDWGDDDCVKILRNVRQAMGSAPCTLVVVECTVIRDRQPATYYARRVMDMQMLLFTGEGREREQHEFEALFSQSGFKLKRIVNTRGLFMVVEAVPI